MAAGRAALWLTLPLLAAGAGLRMLVLLMLA
jgi:hypothetical protein